MILTPEYPRGILEKLSQQNIDKINEYIEDKMTATWFANDNRPKPPAASNDYQRTGLLLDCFLSNSLGCRVLASKSPVHPDQGVQ